MITSPNKDRRAGKTPLMCCPFSPTTTILLSKVECSTNPHTLMLQMSASRLMLMIIHMMMSVRTPLAVAAQIFLQSNVSRQPHLMTRSL
eukprot:scaffold5655_cov94-Skeletonema_marinoi.AAC.1